MVSWWLSAKADTQKPTWALLTLLLHCKSMQVSFLKWLFCGSFSRKNSQGPEWLEHCKLLQFFLCCFYIIDIINVFRVKVNKNHMQLIEGFVLHYLGSLKELKILPLNSLFQTLVQSLKVFVSLQHRLGWIKIQRMFWGGSSGTLFWWGIGFCCLNGLRYIILITKAYLIHLLGHFLG